MSDKPDLTTPWGRLEWARERAGYKTAADFARKVRVRPVTYRAYEAGQNGYAKRAAEFAKKLNVSAGWLLSGGPQPSEADPPGHADPDFATSIAIAVSRIWSGGPLPEEDSQRLREIVHKIDALRSQQPDLDQGQIEAAMRALLLQQPDHTPAR
ncbi:helix-turn-helix domain-containing protein [Tardibacter chloracetimidivorans]|uniref:helix-turn-helix domain-containing protein n=1 Tax=Tardibacter chloracetimidivorans TaxID=1921510 RepID=UPI0013016D30|nr:helix-turn-helix transcriptional regulator [Tardibacter chloracetimidivorans]